MKKATSREKTRPHALQHVAETREEPILTDVVIEESSGTHNVYQHDQKRDAIRLTAIVASAGTRGIERGVVVNTLTLDGPLPALILTTVPTFPGCVVQVRVLGALEGFNPPQSPKPCL
ncbi:MAG: inorganic diphosphatase [Chloroflexi bacterium]|nr:inorganic diphosphatase [Chloroflexota bacterium]